MNLRMKHDETMEVCGSLKLCVSAGTGLGSAKTADQKAHDTVDRLVFLGHFGKRGRKSVHETVKKSSFHEK